MRKIISIVVFFIFISTQAQELNCTVSVNADKVSGTNTQIFKTLKTSLSDFVNKTVWTTQTYKSNEKINCSMVLNIASINGNQFSGTIQIQSSRPIYNSTYSSPVFNYNDKDFSFEYTEFQNFTFNPTSYDSNLVSVVSFYAYIILGMDGDTYAPDGGKKYFDTAQEIANVALTGGSKGWDQGDVKQNRYFLINDMLSNTFSPYRDAIFQYHFEGLDIMHKDLKTAKEKLIAAVKRLQEIEESRPNAFLTRLFFDAKSDEIISIFTGGPQVEVAGLIDALYTLSPLNSAKWSEIKM